LLKLSIAHQYRPQSAKVIQLGLSTIIPIIRKPTLDREELSKYIPFYFKPIRDITNIKNHLYAQRVVKSHFTEHLSTDTHQSAY